jgi:hypothetical protein
MIVRRGDGRLRNCSLDFASAWGCGGCYNWTKATIQIIKQIGETTQSAQVILIIAQILMSRHTSTSRASARRNISIIRPDNASFSGSADHLPALGGLTAVCLFIVILFAFVVQSAVTQVSMAYRRTDMYTETS